MLRYLLSAFLFFIVFNSNGQQAQDSINASITEIEEHIASNEKKEAKNKVLLIRENGLDSDQRYRLLRATLENGKFPKIISLPMPKDIVFEGLTLPASYANFLIHNGAVLVPTFNYAADGTALGILADCFPDREIIGINAIDLIWGLDTLYCLSLHIPL